VKEGQRLERGGHHFAGLVCVLVLQRLQPLGFELPVKPFGMCDNWQNLENLARFFSIALDLFMFAYDAEFS
jgi:hypothetical protein